MTTGKKKPADGVGGQSDAQSKEGLTMAEISPKGNAIAVSTNKLERHHWRMGLAACSQISSSAFRLAVVIEDYMNDRSGEAWPEQETLSRRAAISSRQVREHLSALVSAGWLKVLSGKDRTRPKTRRGLHYRPMWPDQATKDRCLKREYVTTMEPINTGGNPPVSNQNETGNPATQKRKSGVSIPAEKRRNTGGKSPLSYEATYDATYTGRGSSRVPEVSDNNLNGGEPAFAYASRSPTSEEREDAFTAGDPSFAGENKNVADTDASDSDLLDRAEMQFDKLKQFDRLLLEEMRQALNAGRDLNKGQRKFLRKEVMPIVSELESQSRREKSGINFGDDANQLADLMADRMPLALRRWMLDRAVAGADASVPDAEGRDEIVERLQTALLHPAASEHLETALDLFRNDVASSTTAKALNALAATGGGRAAN